MDTDNSCGNKQHLLVGDDPCTYGAICDMLSTCKSAGVLWAKLVDIARRLELPEDITILIAPRLLIGTKTHSTTLFEILETWRGKEGQNARLKMLLDVLDLEDLKECSDALRKHFGDLSGITNATIWSDLSNSQKAEICNKLVLFQGKQLQLGHFRDLDEMDGNFLAKVAKGDIPDLVTNTVSQPIDCYIPRTIKSRNRLSQDVFQSNCNDVFLVQGMERQLLSNLANGYKTDISGNQVRRLNVRFILLQYEPDFDKICKLSQQPVHWIEVKNEGYFWVKSSGPIQNLQQYVHKVQDFFTEKEIATNGNKVIILSDSPGMGKTTLLVKLMEEIRKFEPTTFIHFIVLKEIVEGLNKKKITVNSIASLIAEQSSEYDFGRKYVKKAITTGKCILMLDGFDEVLTHQIDKAKEIIQILAGIDSLRIFVTARPHMREELENELHALSYTIEPFGEPDQLNFLLKHWQSNGVNSNESVVQFAISCLKTLSSNVTKFDSQISGIPLQCRMLAEIYVENAERCSRLGFQIYEGQHTLVNSTFEMYKAHMEIQFRKIETVTNQNSESSTPKFKSRFLSLGVKQKNRLEDFKQAHMYYALELFFPVEAASFKHLLSSNAPLSFNDMCRCGIVEMNDYKNIQFVHRTFAEYFIAMFVVDENASKAFAEFKLEQIFSTLKRPQETVRIPFSVDNNERFSNSRLFESCFTLSPKSFQLNFPVVCYFINEFSKMRNQSDSPLNYLSPVLSLMNVESIVFACAFHNYPYVLVEVCKLLNDKGSDCKFYNVDISNVLLTTAMYSDVELMEAFCQDVDLNKIQFPNGKLDDGTIFELTPLHVAIQRCHYNLVEYLLNSYAKSLQKLQYLLHFCVTRSIKENEPTLNCKKEIIKLLISKSKQWIDEPTPQYNITPLLQTEVSLELLNCLIQEGADVNAFEFRRKTVLHNIVCNKITPECYHQIIVKLCERGFKHFNLHDRLLDKKTSIHYAVENVELLDDTVQLLHANGADFSAADIFNNDSVLFYAVRSNRSVRVIRQLVEHGANWNHRDVNGNSVLHECSTCGHFEALQYFIEVQKMNVNVVNEELETPLHKAVKKSSEGHQNIQRLLITSGANVNAESRDSQTSALVAFHCYGLSLDMLKLMEKHGLVIDQTVGSKLFEVAMQNKSIEMSNNFASVLEYLMEKGGRLGNGFECNPWMFQSVQRRMADVIQATTVASDFLLQAKNHGLLTEDELRGIEETEVECRREVFYAIVREKTGCFEILLKILLCTNQPNPCGILKDALVEHFFLNRNGVLQPLELLDFGEGRKLYLSTHLAETKDDTDGDRKQQTQVRRTGPSGMPQANAFNILFF